MRLEIAGEVAWHDSWERKNIMDLIVAASLLGIFESETPAFLELKILRYAVYAQQDN